MTPLGAITQALLTATLALGGVELSGAQRPRRHGARSVQGTTH